MAYSRSWDVTTPTGSSQISAGDNEIRAIKQDLLERFESVFEDIDDDPLVLRASALPSTAGGVYIIPGHHFQPHHDDDDIEYHENYVRSDNNPDFPFYAGFWLPAGFRISEIESGIEPVLATSIDTTLFRVDLTDGTLSGALATITHSGAFGVYEFKSTGSLEASEIDTDEDTYFSIEVNGDNWFRIYGVKIHYIPIPEA